MRRLCSALLVLLLGAGVALADPTILRRGNQAEPDTLDPQKWFTSYEGEIMRDLFAGLTEMDSQSNAIPGAASSWDESADGLTLTFHLRPEGKWSDGAPVTADDFLLGIRRGFDPRTISAYANLGYVIVNGRE